MFAGQISGGKKDYVEIRGCDGDSYLILTPVESGGRNLPSIRVRAELRIGQFAGETDNVWFETSAIDSFVAQLRELESRRQGVAKLSAMTPGECELRIETADRAGHLRLHIQLGEDTLRLRRIKSHVTLRSV